MHPCKGLWGPRGGGRARGGTGWGPVRKASCLAWGGDFGVALPTSAQGLVCFWARSRRGRGGVQRESLSSPGWAGEMAGAGFRNGEAGAATLYF